MAAAMGHLPVVRRLLRASADAEAANNDGATALMLATYAHKESAVSYTHLTLPTILLV